MSVSLTVVCLVALSQCVAGDGWVEIHLLRYTDNCRDNFGTEECDPMFTLCLSEERSRAAVSPCELGRASSNHFHTTSDIDFSTMNNIKGIPNPWKMQHSQLKTKLTLTTRMVDKEPWYMEDEHMRTWALTFSLPTSPSKPTAQWSNFTSTSGSYRLYFRARQYCNTNYHSPSCDVFCEPSNSALGHYTCDSMGGKVCEQGWVGTDCTMDIDECTSFPHLCGAGVCENNEGSYVCTCPEHYHGAHCEEMDDPCESRPCQHSGVCYSHSTNYTYRCECTGQWEGQDCQTARSHVCDVNCLNGGSCVSESGLMYCVCADDFSGTLCQDWQPPSPSNTQASSADFGKVEKDEDSDFHLWYLLLVIALVLLVALLVLLFVFKRKRRSKKEMTYDNSVVVFQTTQGQAFDNQMYNEHLNNLCNERTARRLPVLPADCNSQSPGGLCGNDVISQTCCARSDVTGAAGGDIMFKEQTSCKMSGIDANRDNQYSVCGLDSIRDNQYSVSGLDNQYLDFEQLRQSAQFPHPEEVEYQDLDELAIDLTDSNISSSQREAHYANSLTLQSDHDVIYSIPTPRVKTQVTCEPDKPRDLNLGQGYDVPTSVSTTTPEEDDQNAPLSLPYDVPPLPKKSSSDPDGDIKVTQPINDTSSQADVDLQPSLSFNDADFTRPTSEMLSSFMTWSTDEDSNYDSGNESKATGTPPLSVYSNPDDKAAFWGEEISQSEA